VTSNVVNSNQVIAFSPLGAVLQKPIRLGLLQVLDLSAVDAVEAVAILSCLYVLSMSLFLVFVWECVATPMSIHRTRLFVQWLVASSLSLGLSPFASHHGDDRHVSKTLTLLGVAVLITHRCLLPGRRLSPLPSLGESIVGLAPSFPTNGDFLFAQSPFFGQDIPSSVWFSLSPILFDAILPTAPLWG